MTVIRYSKIACIVGIFCAMVVASHAQTFKTIVTFNGKNGGGVTNAPIQGLDGSLYGVSEVNVFRITPGGKFQSLYTFCSQTNCADGSVARGPLLQTANGNLYGMTTYGGANDDGEIFEITAAGQFKVLYSFCSVNSPTQCADGSLPWASLILGRDGNFYGTASAGGAFGVGTIFKITPAGKLTTLYNFCSSGFPSCSDGSTPFAPLVLASNGNFYGTTFNGGPLNFGVAFEMTPAGKFTTLHQFCTSVTCTDGYSPYSGLIQASDGNLYGTTYYGGTGCTGGCGTVYQLTLSGQYTTIYSFCSQTCADGQLPVGGVIEGTDGNFYGTTTAGGSLYLDCPGNGGGSNCGTVYQLTPQGTLNVLHSFCAQRGNCPDGGLPEASLLQATDGTFFGSTFLLGASKCNGSAGGCGTLFTESMALGPFVHAQIGFGKVGQVVNILGNNLTETTGVTFNGTPAQFEVMSNTYLKAQVPTGASTGMIEVTTHSGTLNSNAAFQVLP